MLFGWLVVLMHEYEEVAASIVSANITKVNNTIAFTTTQIIVWNGSDCKGYCMSI
jgi:hypothetical protein